MSEVNNKSTGYYAGIIALVTLGQVIFGVDFCTVSVALSTIARKLAIEPNLVGWVIATYSLTYAGFLVFGGRMADGYGHRRFCIFGLVLFGVGLLLALVAMNVWVLIAARALEGLGSAFFIPASFSLINVLLPEGKYRHLAFSLFGAGQGAAQILGLCGGGVVTTVFGWRYVFLITLPLVFAAIFLAWRFVPAHETSLKKHKIDIGGAVLITAVAVLALTALSVMGKYGWLSSQGLMFAGAAVVALGGFLLLERKLDDPLVPPDIYSYANFLGANVASIAAMGILGTYFVLLNIFMQRVLHFTALQSGFGMLPSALACVAASRFIGHGMSKYPIRGTIMVGFAISVAGTFLLAVTSAKGYMLGIVPGEILQGAGGTISIIPLMALSTSAIPASRQGVAGGVLITFQQLGIAFGASAGITVVTSSLKAGDSLIVAFRHGFLLATAMAAAALVCTLLFTHSVKAAAPAREGILAGDPTQG